MTAGLAMAPWVADQARQLLAQNGHAWLLHGPSGLGQYDLALSLASAWLCDQPSGEGACGHCGSCHAIDVRTHADLAVLMPETALIERGWPLGEKAQAEIDDKKRKASREIRVEAMRETIEFSQRTSARGRSKVVLVYPAERMNHVTANALLKTLEEPPGDVKFVLATEASHLLLPTIRSRCMGHAMAWPEKSAALRLAGCPGFSSSRCPRIAAHCRRPARRCAAPGPVRPASRKLAATAPSAGARRRRRTFRVHARASDNGAAEALSRPVEPGVWRPSEVF
jgi:DNA polymerase-3 subunit delta'